jgi:hypothetical protein
VANPGEFEFYKGEPVEVTDELIHEVEKFLGVNLHGSVGSVRMENT